MAMAFGLLAAADGGRSTSWVPLAAAAGRGSATLPLNGRCGSATLAPSYDVGFSALWSA